MSSDPDKPSALHAPLADLEQALIAEFLGSRGYDRAKLAALPDVARAALLRDASLHASVKLAEVESRSRMLHDLASTDDVT
jgi:hypothetical protein